MFSGSFSEAALRIAMCGIPMMMGIILHEIAHGWVAWRLGDPTAKALGRLTLNPIKHIDPMGTFMFILTAMTSWFVIGWAKPVPVQAGYFKNPRSGMMVVSFAGPFTNLLLAVVFAIITRLCLALADPLTYTLSPVELFILQAARYGVWMNVMLAVFNLMPIPPLDGSHILAGLLPLPLAIKYEQVGKYGMIIVIALLAAGAFKYLVPVVSAIANLIFMLVGIDRSFLS